MSKATLYIALLCFSYSSFGQLRIKGKIIDSLTKEPVKGLYFYILKDHDEWVDINKSDSNGNFFGEIEKKKIRKHSTYQVYIENDQYNIVIMEVEPGSDSTYIVSLSKNEHYYPKINEMIYNECSLHGFGDYEPKEARDLNDLPPKIREALTSHLTKKVGKEFYSKLRFSGGEIVDLQRFQKIERYKKKYQWKPYSYYLCFSFSDTTLGIARYSFPIVLDELGNLVEDFKFPDITKDSSMLNFISMETATQIAKEQGYFDDTTYIDFEYSYADQCFTWLFQRRVYSKKTYRRKTLVLAAHSGEILKREDVYGKLYELFLNF